MASGAAPLRQPEASAKLTPIRIAEAPLVSPENGHPPQAD